MKHLLHLWPNGKRGTSATTGAGTGLYWRKWCSYTLHISMAVTFFPFGDCTLTYNSIRHKLHIILLVFILYYLVKWHRKVRCELQNLPVGVYEAYSHGGGGAVSRLRRCMRLLWLDHSGKMQHLMGITHQSKENQHYGVLEEKHKICRASVLNNCPLLATDKYTYLGL